MPRKKTTEEEKAAKAEDARVTKENVIAFSEKNVKSRKMIDRVCGEKLKTIERVTYKNGAVKERLKVLKKRGMEL